VAAFSAGGWYLGGALEIRLRTFRVGVGNLHDPALGNIMSLDTGERSKIAVEGFQPLGEASSKRTGGAGVTDPGFDQFVNPGIVRRLPGRRPPEALLGHHNGVELAGE
jgi:hypothetical protein